MLAALSISGVAALADAFEPFYIANVKAEGTPQLITAIRGSCSNKSHIAVGAIGSDLTQHQIPFACEAILTTFDKQSIHSMVTFVEKATTKGVISFSGQMDIKENMLKVRKIYF